MKNKGLLIGAICGAVAVLGGLFAGVTIYKHSKKQAAKKKAAEKCCDAYPDCDCCDDECEYDEADTVVVEDEVAVEDETPTYQKILNIGTRHHDGTSEK